MIADVELDTVRVLRDSGIARRGVQLILRPDSRRDCASFQLSACSRPPDPNSRIFMPGPFEAMTIQAGRE